MIREAQAGLTFPSMWIWIVLVAVEIVAGVFRIVGGELGNLDYEALLARPCMQFTNGAQVPMGHSTISLRRGEKIRKRKQRRKKKYLDVNMNVGITRMCSFLHKLMMIFPPFKPLETAYEQVVDSIINNFSSPFASKTGGGFFLRFFVF